MASSEYMLQGLKRWKLEGAKSVLRKDEGEQSTSLLQLPPLFAEWCVVWYFHAGGGLNLSSCFTEPFEFVVLTYFMFAHIILN
jgi:hypothetical protein